MLGQLAETGEEQVELRLLADADYSEELEIISNELIDQYIENKLSESDRRQVEQHFLKSQARQDKLSFTLALKKRKSELRRAARLYRFYLPAAAAVILIGLSVVIWQASQDQPGMNKGLIALQSAHREQRPVEARITGLNYAPLAQQRGAEKTDYVQRDLASSLLLNAVSEHPSAEAHHALGQYYLTEHQFDKAIDQFKKALSLDPQNAKIHNDLGAALMEVGKVHSAEAEEGKGVKEFAESLDHFKKALELDSSRLDALFNRALLYRHMGLLPQAEDDWRTYLDKDPDSKWADEARQNLKFIEEQRRKISQSQEEIFQDFRRAYESQDGELSSRLVSSYHNRTGNVVVENLLDAYLERAAEGNEEEAGRSLRMLLYVGELESRRASDRYFSDLARFYQSTSPEQRALLTRARGLMKESHAGWGKFKVDENLHLFESAKQLFEEAGDFSESRVAEYWVVFCHFRRHTQEQNRALLEPLIAACERDGYIWLHVRCLYLLSAVQFGLNEHSKAVNSARRAVELAQRTKDTVGMLNASSALIEYYRYLGNYRKSLSYIQYSLPLIRSISLDPVQGARHYGFMAVTFASIGLYTAAVDYQREALRFASSIGVDAAVCYNRAFLGMIYGKQGNFSEALSNIRLASEIAQARSNEPDGVGLMAYSVLQRGHIYREAEDFDSAVKSYDQAIELYEKLNIPAYLYQAHRGRLLCYMAQKNDRLAGEEISKALSLVESHRQQIYEENNRNTFFDIEQSVYDAAIDFEYSRHNDPDKAFEYLEASRARSLLDSLRADEQVLARVHEPEIVFHSATQPLTLEQIQQRLPTESQILQYAILENKLLIWVISKNKVSIVSKEMTQRELSEKVSGYWRIVSAASDRDSEEVLRRSKELFEILISPVVAMLDRGKQLCIVPDKMLNYLPFATLISPASGKYLIEDHALIFSQSPSVFIMCSEEAGRKAGARDERLLSVGNPRFDRRAFPSLPDLPSAGREAAEVATLYSQRRSLIEHEATPGTVKSEMERADVIHLALHSALDETIPLRSKLLLTKAPAGAADPLSSDSALHAYEIYNLKLAQARLVVLSSCQTGGEHYYNGEGMTSLARPFLAVSVPLVVASQWPVDSNSTAELMISFHRHRRGNSLSTAEALRSAQLEMLRGSDKRLHHPYYWAAFTLLGGYAEF